MTPRPPFDPDRDGLEAIYARLRASTIPGVLADRVEATPDAVAMRAKTLGLYRETTWRGLWDRVVSVAGGFDAIGLAPGDRVAIIGDPFPEWWAIDLAAQGLGAITYGIYPTSSASEIRYLLEHGGARVVVAENQEYVDKVLPLLDRLPGVALVVAVDTRALFLYDDPRLLSLAALEALGGGTAFAPRFRDRLDRVRPEDPATIVYTSGTTARPKGAVLTHGRHLASAYTLVAHYPRLARGEHRTIAYLPLCHVLGRDVGLTLPLVAPIVPHYGESVEALAETIYEIGPTVLFTVPRYLQKFASQALVRIEQTSWLKGAAYRGAMKVGRRYVQARWAGRRPLVLEVLYRVADVIVFRALRDRLGCKLTRLVVSAGAPLPPETATLYRIWGLNVCDLYGQTEAGGGLIAAQAEPFPGPGDVGRPAAGWEVRLGEDGEVLVRSPDLFVGYWRDPEATREVLRDGWLMTGDVGEWAPDGALRLVDRKRDIIVTAGGKTLSPTAVENLLRGSPYIREAVCFGHGRKYVTALIEVDYEAVAEWARGRGIAFAGLAALVQHPAVRELVAREVAVANEQLARVEQVKQFRILQQELDPEYEGDPVTPTRKVKRELMYARFRDLVEEMYDDVEEARILQQISR